MLSQILLVLLAPEPGVGVGDADAELLRALHQRLAVLGGYAVGDLGAELLVLHHQDLKLLKDDENIRQMLMAIWRYKLKNLILSLEADTQPDAAQYSRREEIIARKLFKRPSRRQLIKCPGSGEAESMIKSS